MGIPAIESYPLPGTGDLPENVARWTVDPARSVLLVHDMQRYFIKPFPADIRTRLISNVTLLRDRCRAAGIPIAYTAQPGAMTTTERGLLKDFWGPGMRADPADREVAGPLAPDDADWVFTKWRYSAFFRSQLLDRIRSAGRDQLIVCGVYAHVGILASAVDAFTNDIQPFLPADAIADFTEADHRMALDYAARTCAVVLTTKDVLP